MDISKHLINYGYGLLTLPATFAMASMTTIAGQIAGLSSVSTISYLYRDFQAKFHPVLHKNLPLSSLGTRFLVQSSILIISNQVVPFVEEVLFRGILQDKLLSCMTPKKKNKIPRGLKSRQIAKSPPPFLTKDQILRIGITALIFGALHYGLSDDSTMNAKELIDENRFALLHTMGCGVIYGIAYEKLGLGGAVGAHAAWNTFHDIWTVNNWQVT